jgi:ABC-type nickel/cobalt efflux system permease component RcnA
VLHASFEIAGLAIVLVLIGMWVIRRRIRRRRDTANTNHALMGQVASQPQHDIEHRALMYLMNQKTDALLAALSRTIEQERQKLGGIVRNPSMAVALDAFQTQAVSKQALQPSIHEQIAPLARTGMTVDAIASHLRLPQDEVAMVVRLNAA